MPVFAYHWPKVSPPGITMEELKALKVAAIKDSTGDTERMLEMLACFHRPIYAGNASVVAYAGMLGLTGAILAAANIEPELCADAFAGVGRGPEGPALRPPHRQPLRREGHQGGAGPQVRHLHRLPLTAPGASGRARRAHRSDDRRIAERSE